LADSSGSLRQTAPLCDEELNIVMQFMGTTCSICCREHRRITHIPAETGFWTYVEWGSFTHLSEYFAPLNPEALFNLLYSLKAGSGVK
jgi:hypothetical protein